MSRARTLGARLLGAALLLAAPVAAQWGRGTVSGLVFAASDTEVLAGAKVELLGDPAVERLRGVRLVAVTDAGGKYEIERVPYGRYEFRVSAPGFEPYSIPLYVASDALTRIHARLERRAAAR